MPLVGAHLRVRPGNGQTRGSTPTDAGILQLEIEFVSSVRKGIDLSSLPCWLYVLKKLLVCFPKVSRSSQFLFESEDTCGPLRELAMGFPQTA